MLKSEKRNYAKTFTLELYACEFCELCVQVCPTDAIVMMKSFDLPTADRREMLLDKDRLHAIGQHSSSRGRPATSCATCRDRRRWPGPKRDAGPSGSQGTPGTSGTCESGGACVTGETLAFWGSPFLLVGSALAVVLTKNLFHAVLWLALALTGTAGVFLLLDAEFLAAVQLLLYAGGIVTDRRVRHRRHRAARRRAYFADEPPHRAAAQSWPPRCSRCILRAMMQRPLADGPTGRCRPN